MLSYTENIALALRQIYGRYGYRPYKMSKFEDYDLYARNKDFLISDSIITFTDLSGKLMALKPDVTLSIVKNSQGLPGAVQKLYYNENVYRIAKGSQCFKEIMQVGLECLGPIDGYCISEVLSLAAESLALIDSEAVLDVSDLGLLGQVMAAIGIPDSARGQAIKLISEKNAHELTALCAGLGVSEANAKILRELVATSGAPSAVLPRLRELLAGLVDSEKLGHFCNIITALDSPLLRIDFSVVDDIRYYSGIVFKGFIRGIPGSVLSGGQYDKLMEKMKRSGRAMGFAVYLDMLERLEAPSDGYDVDAVVLYDEGAPLTGLCAAVQELTAKGLTVSVQQSIPAGLRHKMLLKFNGSEVITLEKYA